jgi:hypothetical protein
VWGGFGSSAEGEIAATHEVEESHAPRPPCEVTSGWDVFDPDDQTENTIPTSQAADLNAGWGDDMGDMLDGLEDPFADAANSFPPEATHGHPPELSSISDARAAASSTGGAATTEDADDLFADMLDEDPFATAANSFAPEATPGHPPEVSSMADAPAAAATTAGASANEEEEDFFADLM